MKEVIANKDEHVVRFIHEVSPYMSNVGRGKLKYTYILEPFFSSVIGFEVFDGKLCIGVPEHLYMIMKEMRFFGAAYIPHHNALFFMVDFGTSAGSSHPLAFRIHLRKERVALLENFVFAHIVRMGEDKVFEMNSRRDVFKIPLRKEYRLSWEDY